MHEGIRAFSHESHRDVALDPGFQHSYRLQVAAARATADALGMAGTDDPEGYRADYRLQRMQIQADSEGLDRWAAHDIRGQGLLQEIRASLSALRGALDQTAGLSPQTVGATRPVPSTSSESPVHIPLLPALNRTEIALSDYSASLSGPDQSQQDHYLSGGPVLLWLLWVILLAELAVLGWLFFTSITHAKKDGSLP